jgi:hypothetical protein
MTQITILLSYYNQGFDILKKHIDLWNNYDPEIIQYFKFIIIDDCSLKKPIKDILPKLKIDFECECNYEKIKNRLSIYRVIDDLYCNISGVRNLGAKLCDTEWILILDMDCLVGNDMAKSLVDIILKEKEKKNDSKNCYKFNRRVLGNPEHPKHLKVHPAICLIRLCTYWDIGGCEEDLVGNYGFTDPCFWLRAQDKVSIKVRKDIFIDYIDEGEADIDRDTSTNSIIFEKRKKFVEIYSKIEKGLIYGSISDIRKLQKLCGWSDNYVRFKWEKIELL